MKKTGKALLLALCAVLLVAASVLGTLAYLTDTDSVKNTFTVGKVDIKLDEAPVDEYGEVVDGERVQKNDYKLIPNHQYAKDPTVTVLAGSEQSYVKMTVTLTKSAQLDAIFGENPANLLSIFGEYDGETWIYKGNVEDTTKNTRTYEFWYKDKVDARQSEQKLKALFSYIKVPGEITKEQLATLVEYNEDGTVKSQFTIEVNAYAIQADGFDTAEQAWAQWPTSGN